MNETIPEVSSITVRCYILAKETRERWENEALEAARIKVRTEAVRKLKTKRKRTSKVH